MTNDPCGVSRRSMNTWLAACAAIKVVPTFAEGQQYPTRQVELIVPFNAGGGTDVLARAFSLVSAKRFPQPITVINKPGASGGIGLTEVANAKPDGYKIGILTTELATIPHVGIIKFTYKAFRPIAMLNSDAAAIIVRTSAPWNSVEQFLAAAKKTPGELLVGNAGTGAVWHLAAAMVEERAGVKFNHIPFPGSGPASLALLGGHIDAIVVSAAEVTTHVSAGTLKVLGVMADQRIKGFEIVPTLKESGLDISVAAWRGVGAPLGTPEDIIKTLTDLCRQAVADPSFRDTMDKQNMAIVFADDEAFKARMSRDSDSFKTIINKLDIRSS